MFSVVYNLLFVFNIKMIFISNVIFERRAIVWKIGDRPDQQVCSTLSSTIHAGLHTAQDRNRFQAVTHRILLNRGHDLQN